MAILAILDFGFWILDSPSVGWRGLGRFAEIVDHARAAALHGADDPALLAHGAQEAEDLGEAGGVHGQDHADPHVEDAEHLLGSTSPVSWRKWKSSGTGQLPIRIRAWVSAGRTRGRLSVMPPPVMWAMPCRVAVPRRAGSACR